MEKNKATFVHIPLWDLPIRLFHWLLVAGIVVSWASAEWGYIFIHYMSGLFLITLLCFRFLWGFLGSPTARFAHFIKGIGEMRAYMAEIFKPNPSYTIGHNAVAGAAILALLSFTALQAFTGLFASDDILFDGPLRDNVGDGLADILSSYHEVNFNILLALIALHLASQIFYFVWKRENLVPAMITGKAKVPENIAEQAKERAALGPKSLALALLCYLPGLLLCGLIYFLNE